jgi:mycofactocin glycosyltransferase
MSSPIRPAPPRTTPLPGSFTLAEDPSTDALDDGAVLLGGSPLRLFRITERGRDEVARWRAGGSVGTGAPAGRLARRLVSSGAFTPRPPGSSLGPDDVTVVVPVRDRPAQLERCLRALGGLTCLVVDDGSLDPGATKHVAERCGATFVAREVNAGPSAARNTGLAAAPGGRSIIAFVDSDCAPVEGWLEPLLGHFDDPLVAAVAPRVRAASGTDAVGAVATYAARRSALDQGPLATTVRPGSRVSYVPSAALLVRSDLATGPDLFDPSLRGGEDVDLVWRLIEAGWDVRYEPASIVVHDGPRTVGALLARTAFYGSTAAPLARRHPGSLAPAAMSGWSLTVWGLMWARRPVLAQAALATSVAILARRLAGLVRDPVGVAARIAGVGTARSALPVLGNMVRVWSPALVLGLAFRRTRRAAALALLLPALNDWARQCSEAESAAVASATGTAGAVPYVALHVADDIAYGLGVWSGCASAQTAEPLVPHVSWRSRVWSSRSLRRALGRPESASDSLHPLA